MTRTTLWPLSLLLTFACASETTDATDETDDTQETDDTEETDDTQDTNETEDTEEQVTTPSIVSMTPAKDTVGVLPDSVIEVLFSEAMDPASVEEALTSVVIGTALDFSWPEPNRLVITPLEGLPVVGYDPEGQGAEVDIGIGAEALSLKGEPMAYPVWASFRVARSYQATLPYDDKRTGRVTSDSKTSSSSLSVGDVAGDIAYRGFLTFDLDGVPEILGVTEAALRVDMNGYAGTPWSALGALKVHGVRFAVFGPSIYDTAPLGTGVTGYEPPNSAHTYELDVTGPFSELSGGRDAADDRAQLRLAFDTETDGMDDADVAVFLKSEDSPRLTIDVLVE